MNHLTLRNFCSDRINWEWCAAGKEQQWEEGFCYFLLLVFFSFPLEKESKVSSKYHQCHCHSIKDLDSEKEEEDKKPTEEKLSTQPVGRRTEYDIGPFKRCGSSLTSNKTILALFLAWTQSCRDIHPLLPFPLSCYSEMVKILVVKKVFEIELNCVLVYGLLKFINQRLNVMNHFSFNFDHCKWDGIQGLWELG